MVFIAAFKHVFVSVVVGVVVVKVHIVYLGIMTIVRAKDEWTTFCCRRHVWT